MKTTSTVKEILANRTLPNGARLAALELARAQQARKHGNIELARLHLDSARRALALVPEC